MSIEAVHADPVWRGRADFIIGASIDGTGSNITSEQLWVRRVGERSFEICCIPFFTYDLALGDLVETDTTFTVSKVLRRSGRLVYRVATDGDASAIDSAIPQIVRRGGPGGAILADHACD